MSISESSAPPSIPHPGLPLGVGSGENKIPAPRSMAGGAIHLTTQELQQKAKDHSALLSLLQTVVGGLSVGERRGFVSSLLLAASQDKADTNSRRVAVTFLVDTLPQLEFQGSAKNLANQITAHKSFGEVLTLYRTVEEISSPK